MRGQNRFSNLINQLKINQPKSDIVYSLKEAILSVKKISYPIVIRPSYVLGGRAMRVINDEKN